MIHTAWLTALIDIDRATEFTNDDVDRYSKLVDLGRPYETLIIDLPAIDSAAINIYVQEDGSVATVPVALHYRKTSDESTAAWGTTASTGSLSIVAHIGGHQFIRIYTGANQTADRSIKLRGARS